MRYETVFDAAGQPFANWGFPAFGLLFVAIGSVMVFRPRALEVLGGGFSGLSERRIFRWFFFLFSVIWVVVAGISVLGDGLKASKRAESGNCKVIEGVVSDFHPMPFGGHDTERLTVNGVPFSYSDYIVTAGFHQSASHGGPMREGLPVRICYADGEILRLEVRR